MLERMKDYLEKNNLDHWNDWPEKELYESLRISSLHYRAC